MAEREEVYDRVPPRTYEAYDEFWVCGSCGKVYWRGSHWRNIVETVEEASRIAGSPLRAPNMIYRLSHYVGIARVEMGFELSTEEGEYLVRLARRAIETRLRTGETIKPAGAPEKLRTPCGVFVTLNRVSGGAHSLRGCIGFPIRPCPWRRPWSTRP